MIEIKNVETQDVKMWMPEQAQNFLDNCIGYNLQWMDTILDHMKLSKDDKNAVGEKVISYLHILEAEFRRYYNL